MPDPHDTLAIFAEVSVALAGFSGIVIAFGQRSLGSLSTLEIRRLSNLFSLSGLALVLSLVAISLLHIEALDHSSLWRGASAIVFLLVTPWLILDLVKVRRLDPRERAGVNLYLLSFFDSLAAAMLILQLANCFLIVAAWPFFLGLALVVAGAFQQFILLVRMGFRDA